MTKGLSKDEKARLKAPLVYQEVMSYIKGSAEALEAGGRLSLEQYQDVSVDCVGRVAVWAVGRLLTCQRYDACISIVPVSGASCCMLVSKIVPSRAPDKCI